MNFNALKYEFNKGDRQPTTLQTVLLAFEDSFSIEDSAVGFTENISSSSF